MENFSWQPVGYTVFKEFPLANRFRLRNDEKIYSSNLIRIKKTERWFQNESRIEKQKNKKTKKKYKKTECIKIHDVFQAQIILSYSKLL